MHSRARGTLADQSIPTDGLDPRFISQFPGRVTEHQLAKMLGLSLTTVRNRRYEDRGPKATAVGHTIFYKIADVEAWLDVQPNRAIHRDTERFRRQAESAQETEEQRSARVKALL